MVQKYPCVNLWCYLSRFLFTAVGKIVFMVARARGGGSSRRSSGALERRAPRRQWAESLALPGSSGRGKGKGKHGRVEVHGIPEPKVSSTSEVVRFVVAGSTARAIRLSGPEDRRRPSEPAGPPRKRSRVQPLTPPKAQPGTPPEAFAPREPGVVYPSDSCAPTTPPEAFDSDSSSLLDTNPPKRAAVAIPRPF